MTAFNIDLNADQPDHTYVLVDRRFSFVVGDFETKNHGRSLPKPLATLLEP